MDDSAALKVKPSSPPSSTLCRRNSIATMVMVPKNLDLPTTPVQGPTFLAHSFSPFAASSTLDFDLGSNKSSYTSLRDFLPYSAAAAVNSPTASSATITSGSEISIRNHLVKQAAWAYLQPMSSSSNPAGTNFIHRLWFRLSAGGRQNPLTACTSFIYCYLIPCLSRVIDRVLRAIRAHFSR